MIKKSVLFVSHDASRTGAPIVLKHHLHVIKNNYKELNFDILLKSAGELKDEFENIGNTYTIKKPNILAKILYKIDKKYNYSKQQLEKVLNKKYALVYGNTVVTADILKYTKEIDPHIITVCHVHELDMAIKQFAGESFFRESIPFIDYFIAASEAVKDMLNGVYSISVKKIALHYEHIPLKGFKVNNENPLYNEISSFDGLRICGAGTLDWRKGIDLFIQAAYNLNKRVSGINFHFFWIGGAKSSVEYQKALYDIEKLNIAHRITIIENCPDPILYMSACDVFLLTSREDPFPLVCLEAASVRKPIICFKGSGGMVEFVNNSNGWQIDYQDMDQLIKLLVDLVKITDRKDIIRDKGNACFEKVKQFNVIEGGEKLYNLLSSYINNRTSDE